MPPTAAPPVSPKEQYGQVYEKEHQTTLKVLRAFPQDQGSYKPHERSDTALGLAWRFVMENNIALASLKGPLDMSGGFPPPPATFAEVISAYEASSKGLLATLEETPESRLGETVKFFTGPNQMGEVPVGELLWFTLMDSIHHRGQLTVYVRCAGGKVPSIYGPSADEPWR